MSYRSEEDQKRRESEPQYWFNKSTDLKAAAGAIHYCIDSEKQPDISMTLGLGASFNMQLATWPVYLMLCGLSLELMLKATIVASGAIPKSDHRLKQLASKATVSYSEKDLALLDILSECIYWFGKYPAPLPNHHDALSRLEGLAKEHLTEIVPEFSISLSRTIHPHPLGWEQFIILWQIAADAYHAHNT